MSTEAISLLEKRKAVLKADHDRFRELYQDISDFILPWTGRFMGEAGLSVVRDYQNIIDSTGTDACELVAAGIANDTMSPSEQWFSLGVDGRDVTLDHAAKAWLDDVSKLMLSVLLKSNAYRVGQSMFEIIAAYGTACAFVDDDFEQVIRLQQFEPGEYYLAMDAKGVVNTVYREFNMTVAQMHDNFGLDALSQSVRDMHARGELDREMVVNHAIEPRVHRDTGSKLAKEMPYKSVYWETGRHGGNFLKESGFPSFPCLAPRWATFGNTVYGHSPGMKALGSIKQLQINQLRKSEAIDYQASPPIQVPISMRNRENEFFPRGVSYYDPAAGATGGVRTAYEVRLDINALLQDIDDVRRRIEKTFHANLFTLITDVPRQATAYEIAARQQEKATLLGPVARGLNSEFHDPLVTLLFERMLSGGLLPPPPESLQGRALNVEYQSQLNNAGKAKALVGLDRMMGTLGTLSQIAPQALDKLDFDRVVDAYGDGLGVDPDIMKLDETIGQERQARAQQAQQAQRQASMADMADMAAKLGGVEKEGTMAGELIKQAQARR